MAADSQVSGGKGKPPIIQNPAFPAVVALWFAALLGLGSLVLPVILLESAVDATGLAGMVPAATPPLGMTARALVAFAAALLGTTLGWTIARRLARMHAPAAKPRIVASTMAEKRRPISAHDELGDEGLGESGPGGMRRRTLAIAEDEGRSDYLWLAPLPGGDAYGDPAQAATDQVVSEAAAEEPLELHEIATDAVISELSPELDSKMHEDDHFAWEQDPADGEPPAQFPSASEKARRLEGRHADVPGSPSNGAEPGEISPTIEAEPLPFAAPSLARARGHENTSAETPPPSVDEIDFMEEPLPSFEAPAAVAFDGEAEDPDWSSAPLGGLGLVQLVQRLGSSLEKRRELVSRAALAATMPASSMPASAPEPQTVDFAPKEAPLPVTTPEMFDVAPAEDAAQAMAAYFGRPASPSRLDLPFAAPEPVPAALSERMAALATTSLEPVDDDEEADDLTASFALPLGRSAPSFHPPRAVENAEPQEEPAEAQEASFGSLLNLANPFVKSEEFVRVEEPEQAADAIQPTVVFPGREPSLRAAASPGPGPAPVASSPANATRMFDPPAAGSAPPAAPKSPPADTDEALRKALATLQRMSSSG